MDKNKQQNPIQPIIEAVTTEVLRNLAIGQTKQELEGKLSQVLKVVNELKNSLIKHVDATNNDSSTRLYNSLSDIEDSLKSLIDAGDRKCMDQIEATRKELDGKIRGVESKIPSIDGIAVLEKKVNELPLLTLDEVEAALPIYGMAIRDGLELLQGDERLDKSAIKGLEEALKRLEAMIGRSAAVAGGGRSGGGMQLYDLSALTTGSLKVFTVPKNKGGFLIGTDFPTVLMEGNGFTLNGTRTQLTITATNAPSNLSQLLFVYSSIFNT